jgi:outer membrane protein assembly factor BamA
MSLMSCRLASVLAAILLAHPASAQSPCTGPKTDAPARVGRLVIQGNARTAQHVILDRVPLHPGQVFTEADLRTAEANLRKLGIFMCSPDGPVRPTVTVLDADKEGAYKDILVQVEEAPTGSLELGLGWGAGGGLVACLVLNERNFDLTRVPCSLDDLLSGDAFRGAAQPFRLSIALGTSKFGLLPVALTFGCPVVTATDCLWAFSLLGMCCD